MFRGTNAVERIAAGQSVLVELIQQGRPHVVIAATHDTELVDLLSGLYAPCHFGDNLTDDLRSRGLRTVGKVDKVYNVEVAQGGPIARDKLWFFGSARAFRVDVPIADAFIPPAGQNVFVCQQATVECEQGIDDQSINSFQGRLTWQVTPRNKFAVYADKINKNRGHAMTAGYDSNEASIVWTSPLYMTGSATEVFRGDWPG